MATRSRLHRVGPRHRLRGLALLEVLISMLLIALWLASSAGMQAAMIRLQKGADLRQRGITLAGDLAERMQANPVAARAGNYVLAALPAPAASVDCLATPCTPDQLAAWDLAQWSGTLKSALVLDDVSVSLDNSAGLATYTIRISWREPRSRQAASTSLTYDVARLTTSKVIG